LSEERNENPGLTRRDRGYLRGACTGARIRAPPDSDSDELAALADLTPERFFTAPFFRTAAGDARPILRTALPAA
jgi:hypothetical protein